MTVSGTLKTDIQNLNVGSDYVELYKIDYTNYDGGTIVYFTPGTISGSSVFFNGVEYSPYPVKTEGFEYDGEGSMPRPKLTISNVFGAWNAIILAYNDLVGAKVSRRRTFKKYLDGQAEADPTAQFPEDIFYIEQKILQNREILTFEIVAAVDIEGLVLPKNQCLDICPHRYRYYDTTVSAFDYTTATCPYTGGNYFNEEGGPTTAADDLCAKKLYDCELRYPLATDQLPFKGFPAIGKLAYPYR